MTTKKDKKEELEARLKEININPTVVKDIVKECLEEMKTSTDRLRAELADETKHEKIVIVTGSAGEQIAVVSDVIDDQFLGEGSGMSLPVPNNVKIETTDGAVEGVPVTQDDFVEIAPGMKVAKRLIAEATKGANRHEELEYELIELRKQRDKKLYEELKKDLKISEKITESLIKQNIVKEEQRSAANELLAQSLEREMDRQIQFINVTDLPPRDAAERVLHVKEDRPEWDVEPVDLTDVFKDVEIHNENVLAAITHLIHTQKAQVAEKLPDRIRFAVPNVDLPRTDDSELTYELTYELYSYVHLAALPAELQRIVRMVLAMRSGYESPLEQRMLENGTNDAFQKFCDAIDALKERAKEARDKVELEKTVGNYARWSRLAGL